MYEEDDMTKTQLQFIAVSAAYLIGGTAMAQTTTGGTTVAASGAPVASVSGSPQGSRLAQSFTDFAGSDANAQALVTGLRNGTPITLTETVPVAGSTPPTVVTTLTTIDTPTGHMGWGNVRHALTLARAQLAAQGISDPTPAQIQAALTGGSIVTTSASGPQTTQLPGILTLRSQHMGWGRIAQTVGAKPGAFADGARSVNSTGTITTGFGATAARHGASQRRATADETGLARAETSGRGRGLVTAASVSGSGGHGAAIRAGGSGVATGGGAFGNAGGGQALGHGKH